MSLGVRKVDTHLLLRVFRLPGMDKGDPSRGDRGESQTVPGGSQVGLDCMATAHSLHASKQPSPQPCGRPTEEPEGLSWSLAFRAPLPLCPPHSPAQDVCLQTPPAERQLLTLLHPSLHLTLSAPSSFSAPFGHADLG